MGKDRQYNSGPSDSFMSSEAAKKKDISVFPCYYWVIGEAWFLQKMRSKRLSTKGKEERKC